MSDRSFDAELDAGGLAADLTGSTLGGYTILRRLGQGGMADVYLATQQSLARRVALKVLKPSLARDHHYVRRFHNEAKAVAALVHPHIVQIYEVGEQDGWHFIAQEYVAGHTLKQRLKREGSLPIETSIEILAAAAGALDKAAAAGIIHRDIKPDNILLGPEGSVKVADFGLARRADAGTLELTQAGMTVGTPLYMSPEQIEGRPLDARTDIYSLGVTTYHMLAGRPPFEAETPLGVAMQHVNRHHSPLHQLRPQVPRQLSQLVDRMLAKSPEDRPGSGREVAEAVRGLSAELASGRSSPARPTESSAARMLQQALTAGRFPGGSEWKSLLIAIAVGAILAAWLFARDPLRVAPGEPPFAVPQKENAQRQYFYAMHVNTEESWLAVLEYFPASGERADEVNRLYNLRAKQQLARWYLANDQSLPASELIAELAGLGETDHEFQLFGLAWQAILAAQQGDVQRASSILTDIWEDRELLDDETRDRLDELQRQLLGPTPLPGI